MIVPVPVTNPAAQLGLLVLDLIVAALWGRRSFSSPAARAVSRTTTRTTGRSQIQNEAAQTITFYD